MSGTNNFRIMIVDDRAARQERLLGRFLMERLCNIPFVDLEYGFTYGQEGFPAPEYEIFAFHRSFLMENGWLEGIVRSVVDRSKYLILFSGGISVNMLYESGHVLRMDSSDFYSEKTVSFMESLYQGGISEGGHLLEKLVYGKDWRVPSIFNRRRDEWIAGKSYEAEDSFIEEYVDRL